MSDYFLTWEGYEWAKCGQFHGFARAVLLKLVSQFWHKQSDTDKNDKDDDDDDDDG